MRNYGFILLILMLSACLSAQDSTASFKVRYISSQHIFLGGGKAAGLNIGDHLKIVRDSVTLAKVEVVSISEKSASCRIFEKNADINIGDVAVVFAKKTMQALDMEIASMQRRNRYSESRKRKPKETPFARTSGYISAQLYRFDDLTANNLNFSQPAFRVNFKARNIADKDITFRLRTRTRYNQRSRPIRPAVPQSEWRNRVYEVSLSYDAAHAPFNFKIGRITSNHLSGAGYFDGVQLQSNLSPSLRVGALVGTQPDWRTSNFQTHGRKYGAYFHYLNGDFRSNRFESVLAGVAEYDSSVVSREFVYLQNNFSRGTRLFLYQSAEIDINRDWRKEKAGQTVSLSNLFLSARYRVNRSISTGLTFDDRKNYWTYEIRSLADSLFDDALRLGLRGNLSVRLPDGLYFHTNLGIRKRQSDPKPAYSFSGGVRKTNFLMNRLFIGANIAAFSNQFTNGANTTFRIGKSFRNGHRLEAGYGNYTYQIAATNNTRSNHSLRFDSHLTLLNRLFFSAQYEYDWGSDVNGHRILAEAGIRF